MATLPAYSTVLWESPTYTPGSMIVSPNAPPGYVWVVRDIVAWANVPQPSMAVAMLRFYVDGYESWATPIGWSLGGRVYEARDVRMVTDVAGYLGVLTSSAAWTWRVSGYQLSV